MLLHTVFTSSVGKESAVTVAVLSVLPIIIGAYQRRPGQADQLQYNHMHMHVFREKKQQIYKTGQIFKQGH